jgi:hypothetical protein
MLDPLQFAERLNPAHSVDAVLQFQTATFPQLSVIVEHPDLGT